MLAGVAVFIIAIGAYKNSSEGKPLFGDLNVPTSTGKKPSTNSTYRKITVGDKQITVRVADEPNERAKGLSGTASLPENEGVLFVFDKQNTKPAFWMKDMLMSIDIIWINDGKVSQIDKDVSPEPNVEDKNLKLYKPNEGVDQVLEMTAGWSDKNNIKVGDSVDL